MPVPCSKKDAQARPQSDERPVETLKEWGSQPNAATEGPQLHCMEHKNIPAELSQSSDQEKKQSIPIILSNFVIKVIYQPSAHIFWRVRRVKFSARAPSSETPVG